MAEQLKQQTMISVTPVIKKGDTLVSSSKEINEVFQWFYEQNWISFFADIKLLKLSQKQVESLDAPITEDEVRWAIAAMKMGKSPGVDGFPIEYYKKFLDMLAPILTTVHLEVFIQSLCTFNEALISLIPKKDATDPSNYRPISLINA